MQCYFGASLCMVVKFGRFGKWIRGTCKVVKCGAGEGWRRSFGPSVLERKNVKRVDEERNILHTVKKKDSSVD